MRSRTGIHLLAVAVLAMLVGIAPRLSTQPTNAPETVSKPKYGMPVNNGYPTLARGKNGDIWLAWASRRQWDSRRFGSDADLVQYDQIFIKRRNPSGWSQEIRVSPDAAMDGDPAVVADGDTARVIWSRRQGGRFALMATRVSADLKVDRPEIITKTGTLHAAPRVALAPDGTMWVVWESFSEGRNNIFAMSSSSGTWGSAERVGNPVEPAYRPDIAISSSGVISVAWDGGSAARYGIFLRQRSSDGWGAIQHVPVPDGLDIYAPRIAAASGARAWIAFAQNPAQAADWGLRGSKPGAGPRPVARAMLWTGEGWELSPPIASNADMPVITVGESGGVQVIMTRLKSHLNFRLWESHLESGKWSAPVQLDVNEEEYQHIPFPDSIRARVDQRPSLVSWENRVLMAYERGTGWGQNRQIAIREFAAPGGAASVANPVGAVAQPLPLQTSRESHAIEGFQVLFGDIHTHLLLDDGWTGTADQFYTFARDRRKLDFAAYTPHAESNKLLGFEVALVERIAAQFNQPGRFVGIPGWEWTQGDFKVPQEGHKHVINETDGQPFFSSMEADSDNSKELTRLMRPTTGLMFAHHVSRGATGGTNFDSIDPRVEPNVEIASHWGRFEYFGNPGATRDETAGSSVQDAWRRGLRLGVVGGSDNHDLFLERGTALTAVLATSLDRHAIFEALRARRCYATTGEKILLDVRVNGAPMGSVIRTRSAPVVSVKVTGTDLLERVEIVKFSKSAPHPFPVAYSIQPSGRQAAFEWKDMQYQGDEAYYVRVTQRAEASIVKHGPSGSATSFPNEMAWSSPVWVTK